MKQPELIPELLVNEHCACAENPLWDDARGVRYWCDIDDGEVYEWDAISGEHRLIFQGPEMGSFSLQRDGSLLLLFTGSAARLDPVSGELIVLKENMVSDTGRFNDCIAAPNGELFAGTVDWETHTRGGLFHLDLNGNATEICRGTGCSNGLGWTPDGQSLYWADTDARIVYLFDYDRQSGQVSNRREWLHTPTLGPDGLTVDSEGGIWICYYGGGCVRHYDAGAQLIQQIEFPVPYITSCIFGGADLDELFVTTARGNPTSQTLDGAVFRLQPGVKGQTRLRSKVLMGE